MHISLKEPKADLNEPVLLEQRTLSALDVVQVVDVEVTVLAGDQQPQHLLNAARKNSFVKTIYSTSTVEL